ncbi:hypothetical protein CGRA01v4_03363 [Colletotrichum graminicola]|uniref:Uncharacterized protein n=1 Tax=Colletotrichum graminicola (strain M1.001 / M2 / FGSC 10212) TaxID=645133 RepID=E3QAU1_COLGM|nr:uncharacterized protein GLRG_03123 [Colletotrichum graminicola M1.001]EFQ27979.1 hypothetical protein GLRG_03123 [Colletotrichum graminicola M1.001]WDK12084.1 hypothetical protein CGRA01v4_03363 [Colletotrichum graminicola]
MTYCCTIPGTAEHVAQNKPNTAIRLYIPFWDLWDPSPPRDRTQRDCTGLQPTPTSTPLPPGTTTEQTSSCVDREKRDWGGGGRCSAKKEIKESERASRLGYRDAAHWASVLSDISSMSTPRMNA